MIVTADPQYRRFRDWRKNGDLVILGVTYYLRTAHLGLKMLVVFEAKAVNGVRWAVLGEVNRGAVFREGG